MSSTAADPVAALTALVAAEVASCDVAGAVAVTRGIKQVRGWLDRLEADVTTHLNGLYASGEGAPATDVLTRNEGISAAEARRRERRARALEAARSFGDALATGSVTAEHADALANATSSLDDNVRTAVFGHEASLLQQAQHSTPEQFGRTCRDLVTTVMKDQGIERAQRQRASTSLRRSVDARSGMFRLNGEFDPELGAKLWTALDNEIGALVADGGDRSVDRNQLAAHALGNLVAGGHQAARPAVAEISVVVDLPTLVDGLHEHGVCELANGEPIAPETARRLACEARIIPVVLNGDGVPVDVGRHQRVANRAQRRALRVMYRSCAFDGCDVAFDRCEIHHLIEWEHGGSTDLDNLLPLCSRHHHTIHEGGWTLTLAADRTLTITQPDGELFAECRPDLTDSHAYEREPQRERERARQRERRRTISQSVEPALAG